MKKHIRYLIMLGAVLISWIFIISRPLRFFAELIHNAGHSIGAFIAGFGLDAFGGKYAHGMVDLSSSSSATWFQTVLIVTSAYLLTLGIGYLLIAASTRNIKRYITGATAIIVLIMSYNYSAGSVAMFYSVIFASVIILFFMLEKDVLFKWFLEILGFSLFAYLIVDTLVNDIFYQLNNALHFTGNWIRPASDSTLLQNATGIPSVIWSVLWLALVSLVFWAIARNYKKGRSTRAKNEST